jgi:predicted AAA+ superfamily ATPase
MGKFGDYNHQKWLYLAIMTIERALYSSIQQQLYKGKAILLLGPRQVGKTTLIKELIKDKEYLFLDGDDPSVRALLNGINTATIKNMLGNHTIVYVDEAQRIEDIGITLKIITDQFKQVQLLVSGSSALEINNKTQEPLTGRKLEYHLYPISWEEYEKSVGFIEASQQLQERLIFGMYPEVINSGTASHKILKELTTSYLYKDVLSLTGVRKPEILEKLLRALALQIGSEVSYNELAGLLQIDKGTVAKYIDILEKSFIVFQLNSFNRNQRNEIKNGRKIYFYDNGIRNMIINNLNPVELRNDKGALWENFLIAERIKVQEYYSIYANNYFWRTVYQQEIDFVEEINGQITAFEFKWRQTGKEKIPATFIEKYAAEGKIIHNGNFREFLEH